MNLERFQQITGRYPKLRIAIVGDFCLDRYLEIDPEKEETSIETGLAVYNVTNVRSQPGGAGTILNNLSALEIGEIYPVGFCGEDGEGYELMRALQKRPGVKLDHFFQSVDRRTFTYTKPLVVAPGVSPKELNRLDLKNWTPTPHDIVQQILASIDALAERVDAFILLDQVDIPDTGVVTGALVEALRPRLPFLKRPLFIADSRRGLRGYPPVALKMNRAEFAAFSRQLRTDKEAVIQHAATHAGTHGNYVFITLAEQGIVGAGPDGAACHVPAHPVRGEIDIVGAGDSVTANLAAGLAANATVRESLELAMAASSVVIHQLGTTGAATRAQIAEQLAPNA